MENLQHDQASRMNSLLHIYQNNKRLSLDTWIKHKKNRSTNSEQLALETEKKILREENKNSVFSAIGLADPDTGKIVHRINWTFPIPLT